MIWSSIYILLLALEADGNLIDSRNVFGWQKQKIKKHHHHSRPAIRTSSSSSAAGGISSSFSPSSSPLRRSENVFGWQQPKASRASRTSQHVQQQRGRKTKEAGSNDAKTIIHTASSTSQEDYYNNDIENDSNTKRNSNNNNNNLNYLSPPSIKVQLQPRKKELWLPWPLGAMRNDFYKFAHEQRRSSRVQEWHPRGSSKSQHQYSNNNRYREEQEQQEGILSQGKDWATSILRKTGTILPFPFIEFNNNNEQNERRRHGDDDATTTTIDSESSAGYWIKETTTPMATASSISQNNNNNNKQQGKKKKKKQQGKRTNNHNGAVLRGGDDDANNDHDGEKSYDKDVLCQYLKLQASVRLRQLGYGTFFSIIC